MSAMQAVRIHEYGGHEVLKLEQAPTPVPGDDDVLIKIHATSVNPLEWKIRAGYLRGYMDFPLPWVLGLDISGTVEAVGANVTRFAPGDEVMARGELFRSGAYAEYAAVSAQYVTRKPRRVSHVEAAVVPHATVTAWTVLVTKAEITAGQTVLIHGAAGGVGCMAVQIAKQRGAQVIATASPRNHAMLRALGADQVIDYTSVRFETAVQPVDIVFDTIGGDTLERSFAVVKPGGQVLSIVQMPSAELAAEKGVRAQMVGAEVSPGLMDEIAGLLEAGKLQAVVCATFPLAQIAQAHALSESGHAQGKIAVQVVA